MKKKLLLILLVLVVFLTGCSKNESDAAKFKKEYEDLNGQSNNGVLYREIEIPEDNPIVYTSFKEINEKINKGESFILYVGFSACPWCRTVIPYILKEAASNKIDKIYYINVREDNTKESDLRGYYTVKDNKLVYEVYPDKYYHDFINTLDEFLTPYTVTNEKNETIETGENRLFAPSLIAYKDGRAIALDDCISDNQTDGYAPLTEEMIKNMQAKADNLFAKFNN